MLTSRSSPAVPGPCPCLLAPTWRRPGRRPPRTAPGPTKSSALYLNMVPHKGQVSKCVERLTGQRRENIYTPQLITITWMFSIVSSNDIWSHFYCMLGLIYKSSINVSLFRLMKRTKSRVIRGTIQKWRLAHIAPHHRLDSTMTHTREGKRAKRLALLREKVSMAASSSWSQTELLSRPGSKSPEQQRETREAPKREGLGEEGEWV